MVAQASDPDFLRVNTIGRGLGKIVVRVSVHVANLTIFVVLDISRILTLSRYIPPGVARSNTVKALPPWVKII